MMWFDEIEKKRGSSPVVTDDPSHVGSGTLILDGEKSQAVLLSDGTLMGSTNEDGWFRLRLKGPDGRPILLHNALLTSSTQYTGQHGRMYEEHVYPNAVILGSDALLPGYKVPSIAFTMRNLGAFFHYQHVESHHLFRPAKHIVAALKGLRDKKDRSYDLFKPQEVFVVHQFPRVLSFKVDGHRYEVFVGSKQSGLGWKKIDFQTDPIATIHFAEPLGIEEAMDLAWQWKRYFENLALRPIPWTSLTARSGRGRAMRDADFYLPNHDSRSADENGPFQFWLGNIPLNRWSERNALATVMKTWTERGGDPVGFLAIMIRQIRQIEQRPNGVEIKPQLPSMANEGQPTQRCVVVEPAVACGARRRRQQARLLVEPDRGHLHAAPGRELANREER